MTSPEQKPDIVIHHLNNSRSERICESPHHPRGNALSLIPYSSLGSRGMSLLPREAAFLTGDGRNCMFRTRLKSTSGTPSLRPRSSNRSIRSARYASVSLSDVWVQRTDMFERRVPSSQTMGNQSQKAPPSSVRCVPLPPCTQNANTHIPAGRLRNPHLHSAIPEPGIQPRRQLLVTLQRRLAHALPPNDARPHGFRAAGAVDGTDGD